MTDETGLPVAGVVVVAVPDVEHRKNSQRFKSETADQYGRFVIRSIAPGEYKVFCWESVESQAWEDPEFLMPFEDKGIKVEVREDEAKNLNLAPLQNKGPKEIGN